MEWLTILDRIGAGEDEQTNSNADWVTFQPLARLFAPSPIQMEE